MLGRFSRRLVLPEYNIQQVLFPEATYEAISSHASPNDFIIASNEGAHAMI